MFVCFHLLNNIERTSINDETWEILVRIQEYLDDIQQEFWIFPAGFGIYEGEKQENEDNSMEGIGDGGESQEKLENLNENGDRNKIPVMEKSNNEDQNNLGESQNGCKGDNMNGENSRNSLARNSRN